MVDKSKSTNTSQTDDAPERILEYGTIETALVFLKENKSYTVGDIRLSIEEHGEFIVTGWSTCYYFESITRTIALEDLKAIKSLFSEMLAQSSELSDFVKGRAVKYLLVYSEGKGGVGICSEENNTITWLTKFE